MKVRVAGSWPTDELIMADHRAKRTGVFDDPDFRSMLENAIRVLISPDRRSQVSTSPAKPLWRVFFVAAHPVGSEAEADSQGPMVLANPTSARMNWQTMVDNWMLFIAREPSDDNMSYTGRMIAVEILDPFRYEGSRELVGRCMLPSTFVFPLDWESAESTDINVSSAHPSH